VCVVDRDPLRRRQTQSDLLFGDQLALGRRARRVIARGRRAGRRRAAAGCGRGAPAGARLAAGPLLADAGRGDVCEDRPRRSLLRFFFFFFGGGRGGGGKQTRKR